MVKTPPRKTGKAKSEKPATRKPDAKPGRGHNKPPPEVPHTPPPDMSTWYQDDQTASQIARATAARQRSTATTINWASGSPPFPIGHQTSLHEAMLTRIAALEETFSRLPSSPHDDEIEKLKKEIARLKTLPAAPAQRPDEALTLEGRLRTFAAKLAASIANDAAKKVIYAGTGALWAKLGPDLTALADAIRAWLASLG